MFKSPMFEQLEPRQMLSGVVQAVFSGNNLTLNAVGVLRGTAGAILLQVQQDPVTNVVTLTPDPVAGDGIQLEIGKASPLGAGVAYSSPALKGHLGLITVRLGDHNNLNLLIEGQASGATVITNGVNDAMGAGRVNTLVLKGVTVGPGGVSVSEGTGADTVELVSGDVAGGLAGAAIGAATNVPTVVNGDVVIKCLNNVFGASESTRIEGATMHSLNVTSMGLNGNSLIMTGGATAVAGHAGVDDVISDALSFIGSDGDDSVQIGSAVNSGSGVAPVVSIARDTNINLAVGNDTVTTRTGGGLATDPHFGGSLNIRGGTSGAKTITLTDTVVAKNLSIVTGADADTVNVGGLSVGLNATVNLGISPGADTFNVLSVGETAFTGLPAGVVAPRNSSTTAVAGTATIAMFGSGETVSLTPTAAAANAAVLTAGSAEIEFGHGMNLLVTGGKIGNLARSVKAAKATGIHTSVATWFAGA